MHHQIGDIGEVLLRDLTRPAPAPRFTVEQADAAGIEAYRVLRRAEFVERQGLFAASDADDADDDPRTIVLVARTAAGEVLGGVRLGPVGLDGSDGSDGSGRSHRPTGTDIGWWRGSRLVSLDGSRASVPGVGAALVRAACARAEDAGALRFEATVQRRYLPFFARLGWDRVRPVTVQGEPHELVRWPIGRIAALTDATKRELGGLLTGFAAGPEPGHGLGGAGFLGDDGAPVPGSDLVAACDAILPSMVERDPDWAGWCAVLVNLNDLAAMGAEPVGMLDALGARDASFAARVLGGLRRASQTFGVPVLGGHTQLGVPAALSVTALGRTSTPVPGGGGRPGHEIRLTADLGGGWRQGYGGRQWDSSSHRTTAELRAMLGAVGRAAPAAAKDVSMAGIAGTLGMLAEASGCAAVLDVATVPRPAMASAGDWLTCFPGFGMLTTDRAGTPAFEAGPAVSAVCGELAAGTGVRLRWPDGELTDAVPGPVTGLGRTWEREER